MAIVLEVKRNKKKRSPRKKAGCENADCTTKKLAVFKKVKLNEGGFLLFFLKSKKQLMPQVSLLGKDLLEVPIPNRVLERW